METTIDKAGRVVIPVRVRERAGLRPGTALEVRLEGNTICLVPKVARPRLVRRNARWIATPTALASALTEVNVAALVEEERDRWPL